MLFCLILAVLSYLLVIAPAQDCEHLGRVEGLPYRYHPIDGCYVQIVDGRWQRVDPSALLNTNIRRSAEMKALAGTIGKILFWVFAVLIFFWTASLSLASLREILPGDPIKPYIGLILTDIGALCWLLVFIGQAKGLGQRGVSIIMFVIDLAGVMLLSAYHLLNSGQTLAEIPAELGTAVIWGVIGLTLVNLLAAYVYHLMEPETWKSIEFGVLTDRIQGEALKQAQRNIEAEAYKLGAIISARATADLKYQLRLPLNDNETTVLSQDAQNNRVPASQMMLDAPVRTTASEPAPASWMFWKKNKKPVPHPIAQPAMVTNEQTTVQQAELKPISDEYKKMYRPGTVFTDGTSLPIGWTCPNCGTDNHVGAGVCAQCSLSHDEAAAVAAQRSEPSYHPVSMGPKTKQENPPAGDAPFLHE
jgi:hypothetical protein